jgi:hypothetical protein
VIIFSKQSFEQKNICNRLHLFKKFLYSLQEFPIRLLDPSNQF